MNSNFHIKYIGVDGLHFFKDQFGKVFDILCAIDDFDDSEEAISDLHLNSAIITDFFSLTLFRYSRS